MYDVYHREEQYIKNKLVLVLVIFSAFLPFAIMLIGVIIQLGYGIQFGNTPMSDDALLLFTGFALLFAVLIWGLFTKSNLVLEIRKDGFYYKYFPFHLSEKMISANDISNVFVREFHAIREFGGWGIRYGLAKKGKAYIVDGNHGVQFELKDGKKIMFSTTEPAKIGPALSKIFNK